MHVSNMTLKIPTCGIIETMAFQIKKTIMVIIKYCFNTSFDKKQWDHDISSCIKIGKKKILLKAELYHSNIACKALMPYFFF